MKVIRNIRELRRWVMKTRRSGRTIGFVPTLGAFHEGHVSLMRQALRENRRVVVSLFVNPIQFNRQTDLRSYPRPLAKDRRLATRAGVDVLFVPSARAMYPADFQTFVEVTGLSRPLEGRSRPGHFRGVTTVVTKLLHLVEPDAVYLGWKDAQQARIVRQMIRDLNFPVRLRVLPTVRARDGVALSSRNLLLSSEARRSSRILYDALQEGKRLIQCGDRRGAEVGERIRQMLKGTANVRVEYVSLVDPETLQPIGKLCGVVWMLLAAWVGGVRLIDGMSVRCNR